MFTLWTLFIHRRPFARHLFPGANLRPIRVPRLHAVMEPEIRRSRDEFAFTVSERCASIVTSRVLFRQSKSTKRKKSGWRLAALRVRVPRVDAVHTKPTGGCDGRNKPNRVASPRVASRRVIKTTTRIVVVGNHSFRSTTHLLRANTLSRTHRTKPSSIAFGASIATHTARKIRFRSPCPSLSVDRSSDRSRSSDDASACEVTFLQCEARGKPNRTEPTKLSNAAAAASPARVVHPDTSRSRVPDRVVVHPVVVVE